MSTLEMLLCDKCGGEIGAGVDAARVTLEAPHGPEIGSAADHHDFCPACWGELCKWFPKAREAERLVKPVPTTTPAPQTPPALDSVSPEGLLKLLAEKLGVKVVETPEPAKS